MLLTCESLPQKPGNASCKPHAGYCERWSKVPETKSFGNIASFARGSKKKLSMIRIMHRVFPDPVLWSQSNLCTGEAGCMRDATTLCCCSNSTSPWVGGFHFISLSLLSTSRACSLKPGIPWRQPVPQRWLGYPPSGTGGASRTRFCFFGSSVSSSSLLKGSSGSRAPSSVSQCWHHAKTS